MSNTVLEAMACGLPLVITNVGGNPEVVSNSENGFLFAPGDEQTLALHLEKLIVRPEIRAEFGRASRRRATQQFSVDRTLQEYRNLYQGLAAERGILPGGQV